MAALLNPVYGLVAALFVLGLVMIRLGSAPKHGPARDAKPTAAVDPRPTLPMATVMATLNELAARRDRGEITQGDFEGQKATLLGRL